MLSHMRATAWIWRRYSGRRVDAYNQPIVDWDRLYDTPVPYYRHQARSEETEGRQPREEAEVQFLFPYCDLTAEDRIEDTCSGRVFHVKSVDDNPALQRRHMVARAVEVKL